METFCPTIIHTLGWRSPTPFIRSSGPLPIITSQCIPQHAKHVTHIIDISRIHSAGRASVISRPRRYFWTTRRQPGTHITSLRAIGGRGLLAPPDRSDGLAVAAAVRVVPCPQMGKAATSLTLATGRGRLRRGSPRDLADGQGRSNACTTPVTSKGSRASCDSQRLSGGRNRYLRPFWRDHRRQSASPHLRGTLRRAQAVRAKGRC